MHSQFSQAKLFVAKHFVAPAGPSDPSCAHRSEGGTGAAGMQILLSVLCLVGKQFAASQPHVHQHNTSRSKVMHRHMRRVTFGHTSPTLLMFFLVLAASIPGGAALQEPYASSMRHGWSSLATISMTALATWADASGGAVILGPRPTMGALHKF